MSGTPNSTSSGRRKTDEHRKDRERDRERDRDSTRSSRDKDKDKERDRDRRDKTRPSHSTRKPSSSSTKDRTRDRSPRRERRGSNSSEAPSNRSRMSIVPEMERRPSLGSTRVSSYPSFSKAHSKEAVGSKENINRARMSPYTPEPTDLGSERDGKEPGSRHASSGQANAPPSPPLTNAEPESRHSRSGSGVKKAPSRIRIVSPPRASKLKAEAGPRHSDSSSTLRRAQEKERGEDTTARARASSEAAKDTISPESTEFSRLRTGQAGTHSTTNLSTQTWEDADSVATSVPPPPKTVPPTTPTAAQSSPTSIPASSPRTPTPHEANFPHTQTPSKPTPAPRVLDPNSPFPSPYSTQSQDFGPPPPPPPPPAPQSTEIPRVDYLLQNGGLTHAVPRRFTSVLAPAAGVTAQYPGFVSPGSFGPQHTDVRNIFAPLQGVLDNYLQVMSRNGSLAVATGYRSVARRLLDRLEAVFNRNISSEVCHCIMCEQDAPSVISEDEDTGLSWGEVLEHVSGRRDLPSWPPFTTESDSPDLRKVAEAPMQKLDVDIAPEYRDHFIRQSKKTKDVVQAWLANQPEAKTSPPQEVDDETLIFAVVTHLEPDNQKLFTALLRGMDTLPPSRAPTPAIGPTSDLMKKTALALQRLYKLNQTPRDAECALFLLKNPELHGVLATLAAISSGEWDILVSGRFDGFLWSGADTPAASRNPTPANFNPRMMTPGIPSRGPTPYSRNDTPFMHGPQTRGPTPGPLGAPVQMDEDTEVAVLAEVEREIYAGMDALEDAFEALHAKAEQVREALRARNAGLSMAAARRRGTIGDEYDPIAVAGTPSVGGLGQAIWAGYGDEEQDWNDDAKSEIRPDDSASNISFNRRRRRHREKERRTPAPVEEEDESVITEEYVKPRRK
ncbi:hypothetical protein EG328_009026 [Venturia inaequalis]|uniref:5-Methylcytosine G/T mismatch-specific DNA glycosylase n=2 Tax=Venturia inaequalis TaxID=5025 RepID=A0A8H3UAX7_VENIN|nr:hypothetical protein EG328_009026 [Venturia inaequalis]RDI79621.1 Mitochondrial distribution and morphology protein 31 [Venturia inaequalis]